MTTLQKRIHTLVRQVLDSYAGAWLVWCDPRSDWLPLLQRVAQDTRMGGFPLLAITETTDGEIGGPRARQQVQERIDRGESFVLLIAAPLERCGWLWAHALLAEQTYTRSLREQLLAWGWRPQSLTITDDELAVLARQGLQHDPTVWGGGGLQSDLPLLLEVLAGGATPESDQDLILDLTIEQVNLPKLESPHDTQYLARWRIRALARPNGAPPKGTPPMNRFEITGRIGYSSQTGKTRTITIYNSRKIVKDGQATYTQQRVPLIAFGPKAEELAQYEVGQVIRFSGFIRATNRGLDLVITQQGLVKAEAQPEEPAVEEIIPEPVSVSGALKAKGRGRKKAA